FQSLDDYTVGTCLAAGHRTSAAKFTEGAAHRNVGLRLLNSSAAGREPAVGGKSQRPLYHHRQRSLFLANLSLVSSKICIESSPTCYRVRIHSTHSGTHG